jgi:hypothetical protein
MEFLASLFVGKPLHIALVAIGFFLAFFRVRSRSSPDVGFWRPLLIASVGWALYAAWEGIVLFETPEANIRVDLLVIWPVMAVLSLRALARAVR